MIDVAFYGFLAADADPRISKAGREWVRLRVGVGRDDDVQWVNVAVFGKAAEMAATLKKASRVYIEGTVKLVVWTGTDGKERSSLAVAAIKCEPTHQIGRNRPRKERPASEVSAPARADGAAFDDSVDDLPF
jgi:single-stranded DNA-binding protein